MEGQIESIKKLAGKNAVKIFGVIIERMDENNQANISTYKLSKLTGLAEKTVSNNIKKLEKITMEDGSPLIKKEGSERVRSTFRVSPCVDFTAELMKITAV